MATRTQQGIRFRACQRCGGDAYVDLIDEPEWRCLQCARSVPEHAMAQLAPATVQVRAA